MRRIWNWTALPGADSDHDPRLKDLRLDATVGTTTRGHLWSLHLASQSSDSRGHSLKAVVRQNNFALFSIVWIARAIPQNFAIGDRLVQQVIAVFGDLLEVKRELAANSQRGDTFDHSLFLDRVRLGGGDDDLVADPLDVVDGDLCEPIALLITFDLECVNLFSISSEGTSEGQTWFDLV